MTPRSLLIFAGLTVAALIAAALAVSGRDAGSAAEDGAGQPLIPGLAQRINQVTVLVLADGARSTTLARSDPGSDRWTIVEKAGHPADADQVRRAIVALAGARTLEPRTANPEHYGKLSLDSGATTVTLRGADGTDLPGLVLGKSVIVATPDHAGSFYARRTAEPRAWLAEGRLPLLSTDPLQWLPRDLPSLPRGRVASVTVTRSGSGFTVARKDAAAADFAFAGPPRAGKPRQAKINDLAGAAEFLACEDVAAADPAAPPPAATTVFRSVEGEALTVRLWLRDGHPWATLSAALEGPARSPEAAERVKELQERTRGWSYRLADSVAKDLAPAAEDLFEPPAPADEAKKK